MSGLLLGLLVSTFLSEDFACIAAGALIARGELPAAAAIAACALGIFLGDLGLWGAGRLASNWTGGLSLIRRRVSADRLDQGRRWLDRHAATAIVVSRFTPGARLPLYLAAGLVRIPPARFALWTSIAAMLWTPILVVAGASAAGAAAPTGSLLWTVAAALGVVLVLGRIASRLSRWEFWPAWLFYAPVAIWVAILALRHRGFTTITACNPGIEDGGVVGESKFEILHRLPAEYTIPSARVRLDSSDPAADAMAIMARARWTFPVVLKPDVGQRGVGVRLVHTVGELRAYFCGTSRDVLVQPFHSGPYEAGVFYVRMPGDARGRIFSITDKQFPVVVGDGRSTVAQLIDAHPRYRLQRALFARRHRRTIDRVLSGGEHLQLAVAGNHAQGTTFHDGWHLWTPELERRVDAIAQQFDGFYIGRFDIRYSNVAGFMSGRDLAIVELNGATSESTNIYDPGRSLWSAYRVLFRQWSLVFAIGAANRRAGFVPSSLSRLSRLVGAHLTARPPLVLFD
jgi:membrane protein DedA with SNARE-associated domain